MGRRFGFLSSVQGVDFPSLSSLDLPEPSCQMGQLLLILVTSHPGHHLSRAAIRKTWASRGQQSAHAWQVVFLVGDTLDIELDWRIHVEQSNHNDLLRGNYLDSYRNLTLKVMHGLDWAVKRCRPHFILKTDDDCFVNTLYLPSFLRDYGPSSAQLYVGSAFPEKKREVVRDPSSKWYVSHREYHPEVYPPYASGIGYILSLSTARAILHVARIVPPIPVEDAYVGILAERAGVRLLSSPRFSKHNMRWGVCNYRFLMVIHRLSPEEQASAQRNVLRTRTSCNHSKEVKGWR
ncbi:beta-1,3-galactosyltransferase 5-like [Gastrophryne carolinensis]